MEQLKRFMALLTALVFAACSAHPIPSDSDTQAALRKLFAIYHPTQVTILSQSWDPTTARYVAVFNVTLTGPDGKSAPKTFEHQTAYLIRDKGVLVTDKNMSPLAPYTMYYELGSYNEYLKTHEWTASPWNTPKRKPK